MKNYKTTATLYFICSILWSIAAIIQGLNNQFGLVSLNICIGIMHLCIGIIYLKKYKNPENK